MTRSSGRISGLVYSCLLGCALLGCFCVIAVGGVTAIRQGLSSLQPTSTEIAVQPVRHVEPTSTRTPIPVVVPFPSPTPISQEALSGELLAFLDVPEGPQPEPYVILSAFSPIPGQEKIELRGILNHIHEFGCPGAVCAVPLEGDSVITFRAYSSTGVSSAPVNATVRVSESEQGYVIRIDTLEPIRLFVDSCADVWGLQGATPQEWMEFPQSPNLLNTDKALHYLAAELVNAGIVDVSDCPSGGFSPEGLNACGMEKALPQITAWQNQFDINIWLAGRDHGIPPRILKTLIEIESQFWPENARYFLEEYGLAQINHLGTDALLRWDKDFYDKLCPNVLSDCSKRYLRQPIDLRAMMRGFVLRTMDAECPTCPNGMDMVKAQKSVHTIARALRSTCVDAKLIADMYDYPVTYEDLWLFTLATYHSGFQCVEDGIATSLLVNPEQGWASASNVFACKGTKDYVENFWTTLLSFDANRLTPGESKLGWVAPTFLATRTPVATPTKNISTARIIVRVFIDMNANGLPEDDEWLDGIQVQLLLENGEELEARTVGGMAEFDLAGYPIGMRVIANLPGLYRQETLILPANEIVPVLFMFDQPVIPPGLP